MAGRALPPGAIRRRAAFGLLDADGWTWAGLKATFWFIVVIFLLGYVPNLAYFFTVSNTVEVGYNFASIVNWCPAENEDLPCPTPAGAVLPWQPSPSELALPEPRAGSNVFQSGTNLYVIGGETADGPTDEVLFTVATLDGNFAPWTQGPALPEPRADAAIGAYVGIPYVIGGLGPDGQPTDTVFKGLMEDGELTGWEVADGEEGTDALKLPEPVSGAGVSIGASGFALIGGRDASGQPVDDVLVSWVDATGSRLEAWQPLDGLALPEPRADAVVADVGDFIYVIGGEGPEGATRTVFRLELGDREPATDEFGDVLGWAIAPEAQSLAEARTDAVGFESSGSIYVLGGFDENGDVVDTNHWVVPDQLSGGLDAGWQRLEQIDLSYPVADAPIAGIASTAFIVGGVTEGGLTDSTMRAGLSPQPPFFQLGLAGATLPALSIKGEVGQQLGYLNAAGAGTVNFILLILIGIAFSHQAQTKRLIARLSGGRLTVDPDEEYGPPR